MWESEELETAIRADAERNLQENEDSYGCRGRWTLSSEASTALFESLQAEVTAAFTSVRLSACSVGTAPTRRMLEWWSGKYEPVRSLGTATSIGPHRVPVPGGSSRCADPCARSRPVSTRRRTRSLPAAGHDGAGHPYPWLQLARRQQICARELGLEDWGEAETSNPLGAATTLCLPVWRPTASPESVTASVATLSRRAPRRSRLRLRRGRRQALPLPAPEKP